MARFEFLLHETLDSYAYCTDDMLSMTPVQFGFWEGLMTT